jgi:hypothetical protein
MQRTEGDGNDRVTGRKFFRVGSESCPTITAVTPWPAPRCSRHSNCSRYLVAARERPRHFETVELRHPQCTYQSRTMADTSPAFPFTGKQHRTAKIEHPLDRYTDRSDLPRIDARLCLASAENGVWNPFEVGIF